MQNLRDSQLSSCVTTFKCGGCGKRERVPVPYGGLYYTACSEACLERAVQVARRRWVEQNRQLNKVTPS